MTVPSADVDDLPRTWLKTTTRCAKRAIRLAFQAILRRTPTFLTY